MQLLNWEFIKAKDARMQEKQKEFGGKDNPLNYKNMEIWDLKNRLDDTYCELTDVVPKVDDAEYTLTRKKLVDLSNFCEFLWVRLGEKK